MNPFHFFTRAAVEQFEQKFTQFLIHNPLFQSFAHISSKKAKEVASKMGEEIYKAGLKGERVDPAELRKRLMDNLRK